MTNSIIVYRNPLEKLFWESVSNPTFWLIIATCVTAVYLYYFVSRQVRRMRNKGRL